MLRRLLNIWSRSDSQPTEITLALANVLVTHVAIGAELGGLYIERLIIFASGIYQLYCVSKDDINCRLKASVITFAVYVLCAVMYLTHIGMPTPTHYGWFVLVFAAFGCMRRLIHEKVHRSNG